MIYLISRHPGAHEWCRQQGIVVEATIPHLAAEQIQRGDVVIGTLPIHLAAVVQVRGARYWHLSLQVPFAWRGQELTCDQMVQAGACLEEFQVIRLSDSQPDLSPIGQQNHKVNIG